MAIELTDTFEVIDERFRKMWELYLSYCEGGFRERRIQDVQLLLAKPGYAETRAALEGITSHA